MDRLKNKRGGGDDVVGGQRHVSMTRKSWSLGYQTEE